MSDNWLIIHREGAAHLWNLGSADEDRIADLIARARASVGFPCGSSWVDKGNDLSQTSMQISPGEPHPSLVGRATVHSLSELDRVNPAACIAECARLHREDQVKAAERALAQLPDELVDELITRRRPTMATPKRVT